MRKITLFLSVGIALLILSAFIIMPSYTQTYPSQPIQIDHHLSSWRHPRPDRQGDWRGDGQDPKHSGPSG